MVYKNEKVQGGTMSKPQQPQHWLKIYEANQGHHEMLDNMQDVLNDMDIDCYNDMELARKNQCDLFVVLEKRDEG